MQYTIRVVHIVHVRGLQLYVFTIPVPDIYGPSFLSVSNIFKFGSLLLIVWLFYLVIYLADLNIVFPLLVPAPMDFLPIR